MLHGSRLWDVVWACFIAGGIGLSTLLPWGGYCVGVVGSNPIHWAMSMSLTHNYWATIDWCFVIGWIALNLHIHICIFVMMIIPSFVFPGPVWELRDPYGLRVTMRTGRSNTFLWYRMIGALTLMVVPLFCSLFNILSSYLSLQECSEYFLPGRWLRRSPWAWQSHSLTFRLSPPTDPCSGTQPGKNSGESLLGNSRSSDRK